jgi:hypothetical protein
MSGLGARGARGGLGWLRRRYGAGPLHLLSMIACIAVVGYVATRIKDQGGVAHIVAWFLLALVLHDLVLWPLYAIADRTAVRLAHRHPERLPRVPWINHVRVPTIMSAVLLAISLPLVLRLSEQNYQRYTGLTESPYLGHWLLVTAILFGASAVSYAIRVGRAVRSGRPRREPSR